MRQNRPEFGIPPDGVPSGALLFRISQYQKQGKPLTYLARMNRMPVGFYVYLKAVYLS